MARLAYLAGLLASPASCVIDLGPSVSLRGMEPPAPAHTTAFLESAFDLTDDPSTYQYMPSEKIVLCGMPKCGSTSLYNFVYEQAFGHPWNYTGAPFIQDVTSWRWEQKFEKISMMQAKEVMQNPETFSFAIIRDPVKRIISAWKSKIACDGPWGTDERDRSVFVPHLMRLADMETRDCLDIGDFVHVLSAVHKAGRAAELNAHFRPQQYGCFRDFAPKLWSQMAALGTPGSAFQLSARFGGSVKDFPHAHSSPNSHGVNISSEDYSLLTELCKPEYRLFEGTPLA